MTNINSLKNIVLSVILLIFSIFFVRKTFIIAKNSSRLDGLKQEVLLLEEESAGLIEELEYQKTDEYVEERARNALNLVRPDETVFVLDSEFEIALQGDYSDDQVEANNASTGSNDTLGERTTRGGNWALWLDLLF